MSCTEITDLSFDLRAVAPSEVVGEAMIDFGQFICQPFFWSCENLAVEWIQPKDDQIFSIFKRAIAVVLFVTLGIATIGGWVVGNCLKMAGAALTGKPYAYKAGEGAERWGEEFSLLSFNSCMYESGFPMLLGGVMPASYRVDRLAEMVLELDPDIVLLQELCLGPSKVLMERLKEQYPHFYTNIGPADAWIQHKTIGPELFIASKSPIVSPPRFVSYVEGKVKLGFFCLETPTCWIVNAHFPEEAQDVVLNQIAEEMQRLTVETGKPCVLAGDLNYRRAIPQELFHDPKEFVPTCNNLLSSRMFGQEEQEPFGEVDDFILIEKNAFDTHRMEIPEIRLVDLLDGDNPWRALSDHKPVLARVRTTRQG